MDSIKIQIPEGFKVGSFNKDTGEVTFVEAPKDIKSRIRNFDDVLKHHGIHPLSAALIFVGTPDEIAYKKLKLIVRSLNEGWEPNWNDSNERKYYPWFKMASGGFSYGDYVNSWAHSIVGSRLCFKSADLAKYAAETFTDIYKDFFIIQK